jgi:DNA-binding MarR family transcriptional regulator
MSKAHPPRLAEHLCFKLYSTSLKMTQLYKPMLAELNLTYPQYLVMVVLWEDEGLGIKELSARLQLDPGSVTPVVKRLEQEGYLTRGRDPEDERNRVLTLTPAGKKLRTAGAQIAQRVAQACAISHDELKAMAQSLDQLNSKLS